MGADCCNLVGNFPQVGYDGIISISVNSNTEISKIEEVILTGPTVGTVSITGYAQNSIYSGCPGRAGSSFNWIRKFECNGGEGKVHFIFSGEGQSFIFGGVPNDLASLTSAASYNIVNASSSSGPSVLYTDVTQTDGYEFDYKGNPIPFNTTQGPVTISISKVVGNVNLYLQNFSLECNPGALPTASYSFVFSLDE